MKNTLLATSITPKTPVDADIEEAPNTSLTVLSLAQYAPRSPYDMQEKGKRIESPKLKSEGPLPYSVLRRFFDAIVERGVSQGLIERDAPSEESSSDGLVELFIPIYLLIRDNLEALGDHVIAPIHAHEQAFREFARTHNTQSKHIGLLLRLHIGDNGVKDHEAFLAIDRRDDSGDDDFELLVIDELETLGAI